MTKTESSLVRVGESDQASRPHAPEQAQRVLPSARHHTQRSVVSKVASTCHFSFRTTVQGFMNF